MKNKAAGFVVDIIPGPVVFNDKILPIRTYNKIDLESVKNAFKVIKN